jgi:hypothetical protein
MQNMGEPLGQLERVTLERIHVPRRPVMGRRKQLDGDVQAAHAGTCSAARALRSFIAVLLSAKKSGT